MKALILVDIQNDFLPGGSLGVPGGDEIIAEANAILSQSRYDLVVATQDWHPANHASFAANHAGKNPGDEILIDEFTQTLWPVHCVENSEGAKFAADLDTDTFDAIFKKGTDPEIDSYSGFFDNGGIKATGLADYLHGKGIDEVDIIGLATDYCVKFTALDAIKTGFKTNLIESACRGVNLADGDVEKAIAEMKTAGVMIK